MNPGSYFRFGWQRETERVGARIDDGGMRDGACSVMYGITKGMLDKREP